MRYTMLDLRTDRYSASAMPVNADTIDRLVLVGRMRMTAQTIGFQVR
jgi:hypothetical protein